MRNGTKKRGSTATPIICLIFIMALGPMAAPALADITPAPSLLTVKPGVNTTVTVKWIFGGEDVWSDLDPITSTGGAFRDPIGGGLGIVSTTIGLTTSGGRGTVTETFTIPASIVNTVTDSGYSYLEFIRSFTDTRPYTEDGIVRINIVLSEVLGPFSLRRADLYFQEEGQRHNEITVDRNARGLKAYADLYLNGSGFIEGTWEVDGQRIETVRKYSSFGQKTTVSTSEIPGIPTFEPGLHSLRFVLTKPVPGFTMPYITYLVTSREVPLLQKLSLSVPEMSAAVSADSPFQWSAGMNTSAYTITFKRASDGEDIFSALTLDANYSVPSLVFSGLFTSGEKYTWQVKAYEAEGAEIGRSDTREFIAK